MKRFLTGCLNKYFRFGFYIIDRSLICEILVSSAREQIDCITQILPNGYNIEIFGMFVTLHLEKGSSLIDVIKIWNDTDGSNGSEIIWVRHLKCPCTNFVKT